MNIDASYDNLVLGDNVDQTFGNISQPIKIQNYETSVDDVWIKYDENQPYFCLNCQTCFCDENELENHFKSCVSSVLKTTQDETSVNDVKLNPDFEKKPFICHKCNYSFIVEFEFINHFCIPSYSSQSPLDFINNTQANICDEKPHTLQEQRDLINLMVNEESQLDVAPLIVEVLSSEDNVITNPIQESETSNDEEDDLNSEMFVAENSLQKSKSMKLYASQNYYEVSLSRDLDGDETTTENKLPYQCQKCPAKFQRLYCLEVHKLNHLYPIKPYQCDKCHLSFFHPFLLKQHKDTHAHKFYFKCNDCGFASFKRNHFEKHNLNPKDIQRPYECKICNSSFEYKRSLEIHNKVHDTQYYPHKCVECSAKFIRIHCLIFHQESHKIIDFKCPICFSGFYNHDSYNVHMKGHSKNPIRFKCLDCGFNTLFENRFVKHCLNPTNKDLSYECGDCDASFINSNLLTKHFSKHGKNRKVTAFEIAKKKAATFKTDCSFKSFPKSLRYVSNEEAVLGTQSTQTANGKNDNSDISSGNKQQNSELKVKLPETNTIESFHKTSSKKELEKPKRTISMKKCRADVPQGRNSSQNYDEKITERVKATLPNRSSELSRNVPSLNSSSNDEGLPLDLSTKRIKFDEPTIDVKNFMEKNMKISPNEKQDVTTTSKSKFNKYLNPSKSSLWKKF